jgi:glycosyltransferase involved in cell wall biosynthesis
MQTLKIALTSDPEVPVPPRFYGGLERIVDLLAHGLVERGHDVTVFANKDSNTAGRLVPWAGQSSRRLTDTFSNALVLAEAARKYRFDLIHSSSRLAYLSFLLPLSIPKLMTYHRTISARSVLLGRVFSRETLYFSAVSQSMMEHVKHRGFWCSVPNGVPIERFRFVASVPEDAPLVFLGRIEEIKGPHLAIEVARACGRRLVIAGNVPPEKIQWFDRFIRPSIDGEFIRYIGPVDDVQKSELLGSAFAFLMPILWEEPFGIVMAEALACGTPVLGLRRGAVPEVVQHGVSGYVCDTVAELADAVRNVPKIDRNACREIAAKNFSRDAVTEAYLKIYFHMLSVGRRLP